MWGSGILSSEMMPTTVWDDFDMEEHLMVFLDLG